MKVGRYTAIASVGALLAGCAMGPLPPGGVAALDGYWEGESSLTRGASSCAKLTPIAMTIRNGEVQGEIRNPLNPSGIAARFQAYVETDGTILTMARTATADISITGNFTTPDNFRGITKSEDCQGRLSLTRRKAN
jgi:hypothetical protein